MFYKIISTIALFIVSLNTITSQAYYPTVFQDGDIITRESALFGSRFFTENERNSVGDEIIVMRPMVRNSQYTGNTCGYSKYSLVQPNSQFTTIVSKFSYDFSASNWYTVFGCSNGFPVINLNYINRNNELSKYYFAINPRFVNKVKSAPNCNWYQGTKPAGCRNTTQRQQSTSQLSTRSSTPVLRKSITTTTKTTQFIYR